MIGCSGHQDLKISLSQEQGVKDIVDALKLARNRGAKTICITNKGKSQILKEIDIVLFTSSPEIKYTILGLNSRIAAMAVIDALYLYAVCHLENAAEAIDRTEISIQNKKL